MQKKYDSTDEYHVYIYKQILALAPVVGASAAATFTVARIAGLFTYVDVVHLICFDLACLSYFIVAWIIRKIDLSKDQALSPTVMDNIDLALDGLILLQWNLITYIFPTRDYWGFAPMFVLIAAFAFHKRAVLIEIIGISISIAISWLLIGDKLLPVRDELYLENLILRIVALIISFVVIYALTYYAEGFTDKVKEDYLAIAKQNKNLEMMGRDVIDFTADIIEERDSTSGSHVKRLKAYTRILAECVARKCPEYGLTEEKVEYIALACVLHDVGKIGIPDNILLKPGKLTPEEFEIIKSHTTKGAHIIDRLPDSVGEDYKRYCREICQFHHEKYDGKGYPNGLVGDDIPISAQIVSVVDCYDALSNERPYKSALPGEVAINMILNGECGAFSEKMKECIIESKDKLLNS